MADVWKSMLAKDAISGKEGTVHATINGEVIPVAECKNINAKITKKKNEFKSLGHRGSQYKATGWSGSGTLTIHYASSRWAKMMIDYANKGIDTYFKIDVVNEDPTSSIGKQTVTLISKHQPFFTPYEFTFTVRYNFSIESTGFTAQVVTTESKSFP